MAAHYIVSVKIERIQEEEKDRYDKVIAPKHVAEMVNVRMLASSVSDAIKNATAAVNLISSGE